jgi:hypothetical protein
MTIPYDMEYDGRVTIRIPKSSCSMTGIVIFMTGMVGMIINIAICMMRIIRRMMGMIAYSSYADRVYDRAVIAVIPSAGSWVRIYSEYNYDVDRHGIPHTSHTLEPYL